jgi:precorrin-6B methylase 2
MIIALYIPHVLFFLWMIFAILSIVKGAPFVLTKKARRAIIISFADIKYGEKAVDIGSGDGSIVIEMARAGAEAHGYEINLLLVLWSKLRIWKAGLNGKAFVHWGNMWKTDFSPFSVVVVYGIKQIMHDLEEKLNKELKPGTRVISNTFPFPNWKVEKEENLVFLYRL